MDENAFLLTEKLCEELYNPKSPETRLSAEVALVLAYPSYSDADQVVQTSTLPPHTSLGFASQSPAETFLNCRFLLENTQSPYVQMFATSRVRSLVTAQFTIFNLEQKLEISNR
jgi:exportin-7